MKKSLKEIAKETGYSLSTVSRALSGSRIISADTRNAIRATAETMGYRAKSKNVVIIPPSLWYSPYYAQMIGGISTGLLECGFSSIVLPYLDISKLDDLNYCGVVSLLSGDELCKDWSKRGNTPLISVNSMSNSLNNCHRVSGNDRQGLNLLVNYLVSKGHRRIARIGGTYSLDKENWSAVRRNRIYDELADKHGLDKSMLYGIPMELQSIMELLSNCLERNVTALLVLAEDYMLPVLYAIRLMRIKVPEEMTIVGWYYEKLCQYMERNFFGITHDYIAFGQKTAELMTRLYSGEKAVEDISVDYLVSDPQLICI